MLVSDGKRRKVIKGKVINPTGRVEAVIGLYEDGTCYVTFYTYDAEYRQHREIKTREFPNIDEAKAATLMEVTLKGSK